MQLRIRQRIFSWTDSYDVYDETGKARYEVRAEFPSLLHRVHIYDRRTGQEVGCVRQKLLCLLPTFEIEINGRDTGHISSRYTLLKQDYELDYLGWEVEGDFMGWDFRIKKDGTEIMTITKELWNLSDTYTLRFPDAANEIPGLLLVIAIDAANCTRD